MKGFSLLAERRALLVHVDASFLSITSKAANVNTSLIDIKSNQSCYLRRYSSSRGFGLVVVLKTPVLVLYLLFGER